jgi:hypothetical protein
MNSKDTSANATNTPKDANDSIMNAKDKAIDSPILRKVKVSRAGDITAEIENSSKRPLRIWENSNSWGAACWRVMLVRNGRVEAFYQNPDQRFTTNWPAFNEITPGAHREQKLDLNGGDWCGLGHCSRHNERGFGGKRLTFEANDVVIVIYDVPATQEARDMGVWYGVIAGTAIVQ